MNRMEDKPRCAECNQPLSSWAEPHTIDDCRWWQQTQPVRDALVGLSAMQADLNRIATDSTGDTDGPS